MSITGAPDGEPAKVGVAIIDIVAGLMLGQAITAALFARQQTGTSQKIETSLLEAGVASLVNAGSNYLVGGDVMQRHGNAHLSIVPYQSFKTQERIFGGWCGQRGNLEKVLPGHWQAQTGHRPPVREKPPAGQEQRRIDPDP